MSKTLAAALLPPVVGTLVGESIGKGLDLLSSQTDPGQAKLVRQIETIAASMTSAAINQHEFSRVASNDIEAAILAVADTLSSVPIDGPAIRESRYSAVGLADHYRKNSAELLARAGLGEAEHAYVRILESVSQQIVSVLRVSPEAHGMAVAELTAELDAVRRKVSDPASLYRELQYAALDEFLLTYRLHAGKRLSRPPRRTSGGNQRRVPVARAYVEPRSANMDGLGRLEELLKVQRRILIEADPGQGKSMMLVHTFLTSLAGSGGNGGALTPIYLDCRGLREFPDLEASVARVNKWLPKGPDGWVEQSVRAGEAMILLDNVEYLLGDNDSRMRNQEDFDGFMAEVVGESVIIVAARRGTLGDGWAERNGFSVMNLEPSTAGQVLQQVERWHEAVASECETIEEQERVAARGRELEMALCQLSALMGMSRNPRICALMCEAFLDSLLSLPRDWITLVEDVLERFAGEDSELETPVISGTVRMRDLQRGVARWALHNESPFASSHLVDAVQEMTAGWNVEEGPPIIVERILSRTTLLRRSPGGLAFVNEELRDHLVASDLMAAGHVNYLRAEARSLRNSRLVVAAAGSARHERATELVTALLDDAKQFPEASEALVVTAYCCAAAARSIETETRNRLQGAVADLVRQGNVDRLADPRIASLALDMFVRLIHDEGHAGAAVAAIEVGARIGEDALPALRSIAGCSDGCQEILWKSWSRFDIKLFATTVLSVCTSVPDILMIDSPEKFAALADLPLVTTVEVMCQVDATKIRGREGLIVRVTDITMLTSADDLDPNQIIIKISGGG